MHFWLQSGFRWILRFQAYKPIIQTSKLKSKHSADRGFKCTFSAERGFNSTCSTASKVKSSNSAIESCNNSAEPSYSTAESVMAVKFSNSAVESIRAVKSIIIYTTFSKKFQFYSYFLNALICIFAEMYI